jgi:hypothetical protein
MVTSRGKAGFQDSHSNNYLSTGHRSIYFQAVASTSEIGHFRIMKSKSNNDTATELEKGVSVTGSKIRN